MKVRRRQMSKFKPAEIEDAVEVTVGEEDIDPHEVILALIKSLDSREAEGIIVESAHILAKASGVKAQLDTLRFMEPTLIGLDEDTEEMLSELENELSNLATRDALILDRFQEIVQEHKKANGKKTDI
jgi:hypothetical protein